MSQNSNFLKNTLDLLEADPEVKSYIYQQILDFNPFVTPETLVMVIARDPQATYEPEQDGQHIVLDEIPVCERDRKYRIAVILKDGETSIESEAYDNDLFLAIRAAKDKLVARLIEIQEELESPQDRMNAIKEARENKLVH